MDLVMAGQRSGAVSVPVPKPPSPVPPSPSPPSEPGVPVLLTPSQAVAKTAAAAIEKMDVHRPALLFRDILSDMLRSPCSLLVDCVLGVRTHTPSEDSLPKSVQKECGQMMSVVCRYCVLATLRYEIDSAHVLLIVT